jgi:methionine aminopeptidase
LFLAKAWLLGPDERNARHGHLDIIGYAEAGNWSRRSHIGLDQSLGDVSRIGMASFQTMIWARKPIHVELMKVQQEVFAEVMAKLKPGLTVRELALQTEKASDKARPKSGHAANCIVKLTLHGRGAGDDGPIITNTSRNQRDLDVTFKEKMVFIVKPSVETANGTTKSICTWGDTVVVTQDGGKRLGTLPHDLAVSGR